MNKFDFVSSPRFWQLCLVGLIVGLNFPFPNNVWLQGASAMIGVWFGGSVAVRTLDRNSDKQLEGTKITAGQTTEQAKVI